MFLFFALKFENRKLYSMSTPYFGPVRPNHDEIRPKGATFDLRPGGGLGYYQGKHRAYHRQGSQEVRRHPVQIYG